MDLVYSFQFLLLVILSALAVALGWLVIRNSEPDLRAIAHANQGAHTFPFRLEITLELVILILTLLVCGLLLKATHFTWCSFLTYWWPDMPPGNLVMICS